jgi:ADP-ribosylation factor protein 1
MGCFIDKSEGDEVSSLESRKLKVVMVGLEGSGKTSLLYYMKNNKFTPT